MFVCYTHKEELVPRRQNTPTTVIKGILAQCLDFMVAKGWGFNCELEGFGALMPDAC
jgi:hypothetical protein